MRGGSILIFISGDQEPRLLDTVEAVRVKGRETNGKASRTAATKRSTALNLNDGSQQGGFVRSPHTHLHYTDPILQATGRETKLSPCRYVQSEDLIRIFNSME
jgi:hypothetical protein